MMSWPSTPGSLGLHISISNWLFSPVALFRTNRFLRFVLDKFTVSAVWTAHVSVPYSDWQDIREEHRMATDCRNWLPCVLLAYSCIEVLWYTGYFFLFKSRDFQKCRSDLQISFAVTTKMDLFSVVWAGPKKTRKLWLELFLTDHVITSAVDDIHIYINYSNFMKIIYERGNRCGFIHPKFLEHGDFLVKRFLHNFEHRA